jgi:PAS domain-containing protein
MRIWHGLVDPASEVLFELDEHGAVIDVFPPDNPLGIELPPVVIEPAATVRSTGQPAALELPMLGLRARIAADEGRVCVLLRRIADREFWALFEAAPLPLVIEIATDADHAGASRLNRRFTELFGYTADDIPSVQAWWPLAYPDPVYRERIRDEWFRRVSRAAAEQSAIQPMEATVRCKDGSDREIAFFAAAVGDVHVVIFSDLSEAKDAARRLAELSELVPVCAWCKKLRADKGFWEQVDVYVARRTGAKMTHGICPDCRDQMLAR